MLAEGNGKSNSNSNCVGILIIDSSRLP